MARSESARRFPFASFPSFESHPSYGLPILDLPLPEAHPKEWQGIEAHRYCS